MNVKAHVVLLCVFAAAWTTPIFAQMTSSPSHESGSVPVNSGEAIAVGPFLFSPALQLTWERRDNIFFQPVNPVDDTIYLARARLMFELPIYESYVRFTYTPQYREYEDYQLLENWSHFVDFNTALEFANGLQLKLDYRFVNANLETSEVDPGGELVFGNELFTKNYAALALDYWVTARDGIRIDGSFTDLAYDRRQGAPFYDYRRTSGGLGWLHQVSPTLVMDLSYRRIDFDPKDTLTYRKSTSDEVTLGFRGLISPVLSSNLRLGWRETDYDVVSGDPNIEKYSGPVVEGSISWELAHGSTLRLAMLRSDYPSNFAANANYTATGAGLVYDLNRDKFFGEAFVRYQNNDYELPDPLTGLDRSDDIKSLGLTLGYRFTDLFTLRGELLHEDRDTLFRYSYEATMIALGLVFGF